MEPRTLPHALEAEKALIGAVLTNGATYDRAALVIKAEDFYRDAHRRIWLAIGYLLNDVKIPVDLVTLKDELVRRNELDEVGGPAYISAMTDGVPRSINAEHYAGIVKEKSMLRALIGLGNMILEDAYYAEASAKEIVASADRNIVDLQRGAVTGRMVDIRESSTSLYARIEHNVAHKGQLRGVDTGFASINEQTFASS